MQNIRVALLLSLLLTIPGFRTVSAAPGGDVTSNEIVLNFPTSATFRATFSSDVDIVSVVLEYGNEQQTCGEVVAKAFPQFTPGRSIEAEWTWEMRQSGSLPPGAQLWWRWRMTDASGAETVTETETAVWLDEIHPWKTTTEGEHIVLHWYEGDQSFARDLAGAAADGLAFNQTRSGLTVESPIDIYIYAGTDDLKEAILYEPSWTGGQAFPDQDIVILGISPSDMEWGRGAIVHELTHVLVGHLTFSCLGDVPTWLNEGLAMYSEGGLDPVLERQLEEAIRNDGLFTIRSLTSGFSEIADQAYLSYSQSYSITKYLVETHGQDDMRSLLVSLRDGSTIDEALLQTYGFNTDGLEGVWRESIGAPPPAAAAQSTAQPTPTFVPTIVPLGGVPPALQATPSPVPTSSVSGQPTEAAARTGPPLELTLILLGMCCLFLLLIGVVVLGFVVRRQNREGTDDAR